MGTWEDIETDISTLRDKLWKEDKIRIEGHTYSEWKEEQKRRLS